MIPTTRSKKPLLFWLVTVLVLSVIPPAAIRTPEIDHIDLLAHAVLYAITGALFYVELRSSQRFIRSAGALGILAASAYGMLMEVIQNYVPQREFSLLDAAANAVGACIGVWLVWMRIRQVQKRRLAGAPESPMNTLARTKKKRGKR